MPYALRLFVLFLCALPLCGGAQTPSRFALSGHVLDPQTGTALVGAHVFLVNSTLGTVTDSTGHFVLDHLSPGTYEIAASMLGFTLETVRVTFPGDELTPHLFRLTPRVLRMGEVVVAANRSPEHESNWARYIEVFTEHFLGTTPNASKCTLLNPEVLVFTSAPGEDRLRAISTEPLAIENRALGYLLYYHLEELEANDTGVRYYGTMRFEELLPRNRRERRRWQRARRDTYTGSTPHFLATLLQATDDREVRRQGFRVGLSPRFESDPMYAIGVHTQALMRPALSAHTYLLDFPDYLQVIYQPEVPLSSSVRMPGGNPPASEAEYTSWIKLNGGAAEVDAFGHFSEPYAVTTYGLWGRSRVADTLPRNYRPD